MWEPSLTCPGHLFVRTDWVHPSTAELHSRAGVKAVMRPSIRAWGMWLFGARGADPQSLRPLLEAGVQRHLTRLGSLRDLRDLRGIFGDLGDLRVEVTMLARFALAELDREADLLRIVLAESRSHPDLLESVVEQLVDATWTGFANWIAEHTGVDADEALSIASVGLGALFSTRLLRLLLGRDALAVTDDAFVSKWVEMVLGQVGGSVV